MDVQAVTADRLMHIQLLSTFDWAFETMVVAVHALSMIPDWRQNWYTLPILFHLVALSINHSEQQNVQYWHGVRHRQSTFLQMTCCRYRDCKVFAIGHNMYSCSFDGRPAVVKFAQRYGKEVHEAFARRGCAPEILAHSCIAGLQLSLIVS